MGTTLPVEESNFEHVSLARWCCITAWCSTTAAEGLNPQQQHQSHPVRPNRPNLLLGRLTEDHSSMEMRLGSQRFREALHNLQILPSRSPGEKTDGPMTDYYFSASCYVLIKVLFTFQDWICRNDSFFTNLKAVCASRPWLYHNPPVCWTLVCGW